MHKILFLLAVCLLSVVGILGQTGGGVAQGTLAAFTSNGTSLGNCPLKRTEVKAEISGFLARVRVAQEFENNFNHPIEAVYKFPLPENSAVDGMKMTIGERVIRAEIKQRDEAREIYESAKTNGNTAALLDQERPNIFTQQVANILPNEKITVEIDFVETLTYEDGEFEFVFPMTVGERYVPKSMSTISALKLNANTSTSRTGHDISINVNLDAGVPIEGIRSNTHLIETLNYSPNTASVKLKDAKVIPNKDFILRYDVTGGRIEDAVLTHRDERGGFFSLILSPPEKFAAEDITPKEIVFVLDTSGSMGGFPIEKAKEAMVMTLAGLNSRDTFNLITFAGDTHVLFAQPVPATSGNLAKAKEFLLSRSGAGGTEMMTAIRTALEPSDSQAHIRIVCFMTDGYVGDDMEIIDEVRKHPNARIFSFGIGSSVNRFLLDKIAEAGRGEVEYVGLEDDGSKAARRFYERVRMPLLTDISIDWNGLPVEDVYPQRIPDLFSAKPVVIHGRYLKAGRGTIKLRGLVSGQDLVREINVDLPETESKNDVLATLWARTRIDDLMAKDWAGVQNGTAPAEIEHAITRLGLDFRLMTQFTSFVAVEEIVRTQAGAPARVDVPTTLPDGVRNELVQNISESPTVAPTPLPPRISIRPGAGNGRSFPQSISGGVVNGKAVSLPKPVIPSAARTSGMGGTVSVQVVIDENGNVVSSSAVSGNPLLRKAAEQAAMRSRFAPTLISGRPIKVSGVITYNFDDSKKSGEDISYPDPAKPEVPQIEAMKRRQLLEEKLDPQLLKFLKTFETGMPESLVSGFFVDGKLRILILLTGFTPEVREKLTDLGFVSINENGSMSIIGEIAPENLAALTEIAEVKYIFPKIE